MHNLRLFLIKLSLLLLEGALLDLQIARQVLCELKLLSQFDLSLVHLMSEVLSSHINLLKFNFELFHLLNSLLLFSCCSIFNSFFVDGHTLQLHFEVNGAISDLPLDSSARRLLVVNISIDVLFLDFIFSGRLCLALGQLCLLSFNFALSLLELKALFCEHTATLFQSLLLSSNGRLSCAQLPFLLSR